MNFLLQIFSFNVKKAGGRRQRAEGKNLNEALTPPNSWPPVAEIMVGDSDPSSFWSRASAQNSIPTEPPASCLLPSAFLVDSRQYFFKSDSHILIIALDFLSKVTILPRRLGEFSFLHLLELRE